MGQLDHLFHTLCSFSDWSKSFTYGSHHSYLPYEIMCSISKEEGAHWALTLFLWRTLIKKVSNLQIIFIFGLHWELLKPNKGQILFDISSVNNKTLFVRLKHLCIWQNTRLSVLTSFQIHLEQIKENSSICVMVLSLTLTKDPLIFIRNKTLFWWIDYYL